MKPKDLRVAKITFLGVVGVLVFLTLILMFKSGMIGSGEPEKPEEPEEIISESNDDIDQKDVEDIEEKYKKEDEGDVEEPDPEPKEEPNPESPTDDIGYDDIGEEFDFIKHTKDKVGGKKAYKKLMQRSEKAIQLLVNGEKEGWEGIANSTFLEKIEANEINFIELDGKVEYEVFPTEQHGSPSAFTGAMITYDGITKSYALIFDKEKDEFLLTNIVLMWSSE